MKKELDEELEEDSDEEDSEEEESEGDEEFEPEEPLILEEPKIDLNLNFNELDFSQFTPSIETTSDGSPVLESIESRIDTPGFVQMGTASFQSEQGVGESGRDTYMPSQDSGEGPKYIQSEGGAETNVGRVDMRDIGRNFGILNISRPDNFFISSESDFQSGAVERTGMPPERVDFRKVGMDNPLEIEERKYAKHEKYEFKS